MEWKCFPALLIILPLVGSGICSLGSRKQKMHYVFCVCVLLATTATALLCSVQVLSKGPLVCGFSRPACPNLVLNADALGTLLALLSSFLCLACISVSRPYGVLCPRGARYCSSLLILCAGLNGIFLSGDLLLLMVFWELMIVSSYFLIVHSGLAEALSAGRKYFVMSQAAAVLLVLSAAVALGDAGTLSMTGPLVLDSEMARLAFVVLALLGFGIDAAVVPFHVWLPDAHSESPTPISALLSGIVVKTGLYGMIRFFHLMSSLPTGLPGFIVPFGLVTALVGVFVALFQMDGKRLIAWSTVSQVGLIVVGLGSGSAIALTGATFHLLNHSVFKSLLFLSVGWVMSEAGTRDLPALRSRVGRWPRPIFAFYMVGLLSISGVPPLNGFYSKSIISKGLETDLPAVAVVLTFLGTLTLLSFMRLGW